MEFPPFFVDLCIGEYKKSGTVDVSLAENRKAAPRSAVQLLGLLWHIYIITYLMSKFNTIPSRFVHICRNMSNFVEKKISWRVSNTKWCLTPLIDGFIVFSMPDSIGISTPYGGESYCKVIREGGNSMMNEKCEADSIRTEERPYNLQLQDEIDYVTLGRHLRDVRKAHPYTQAQISEILGLKPNYYGQYETGARHINLPRFIQFICKTQCSADVLLTGCHKDYPSLTPTRQGYSETRKEINSILDKCDDELLKDLIVVAELLRKRR